MSLAKKSFTKKTSAVASPSRYLFQLANLLTAAAVLVPVTTCAAQSESAPVPGIALENVKALPGASVMVPLSFTPEPKNPVGGLTADIEYVSNSLVFEKTAAGLAAEMVNAEISAKLSEQPPDEKGLKHAVLRITIALRDAKTKPGLPEGLLAYLVFQVGQNAKPLTIKLSAKVASADDVSSPPRKLLGIAAESGSVTVENPDTVLQDLAPELKPDVGCFFFTH